jgi:hypothetical protein
MLSFLEIFTGIGTTDEAGLFIPTADLVGMEAGEITDTGATLEAKIAYGLLNGLYYALAEKTPLGFENSAKLDPSGAGINRFTEGITINFVRLIDLRDGSVGPVPLPISGENQGRGGLTLADCWQDCEKLGEEDATPGAGLLIPDSWIAAYGGWIPGTVDLDARSYFAGLMIALCDSLPVRTGAIASAITRKTNTSTVRVTGLSIPTEYYQAENPTSGVLSTDLPFLRLMRETFSIEWEIQTDPIAQTFEINVRAL